MKIKSKFEQFSFDSIQKKIHSKMFKDNFSIIILTIFIIYFFLSDYQLYEIIQNESNLNVSFLFLFFNKKQNHQ